MLAGAYFVIMTIVSFKYHIMGGYGVETDFYIFVAQTKDMLRGEFFSDGARGPVYYLILAGVAGVVRDYFRAGLLIGIISASLALSYSYLLLGRLFRRDIAFVGALLIACNPVFVQYTYSCGTDMPFVAFATIALYYMFKPERLGLRHLVVSSVLAALAYLTSYKGVFLLGGLLLGVLFFNMSKSSIKRRVVQAVIACAVFFLVTVPWGAYCLSHTGDFFLNKNYMNIAYAIYGQEVGWDAFCSLYDEEYRSFFDVIGRDPGRSLKYMVSSVYGHFTKDMGELVGWHMGALVIVGIVFSILRRPSTRQIAYYGFNVLLFGVLLSVIYNPRWSLFLVPFYTVLALHALLSIGAWLYGSSGKASALSTGLALILTVWTAVESYSINRDIIGRGPGEVLAISRRFKARVPYDERGKLVVARKPHIAYYLDMDFEWIPYVKDVDELVARLKDMKADYLYFSYMEAGRRPELTPLLDHRQAPPGLQPFLFSTHPPAVLYRVEAEAPGDSADSSDKR